MNKQTIVFFIIVVILLALIYWATYNTPSTDPNSKNYIPPKGTREGGYNTNQN